MTTLLAKQWQFSRMVAQLLARANELGFEVTLGEAWRPQATADCYRAQGKGISNSLHMSKLAIDLNLFRPDGTFLTDSLAHQPLGEWWESLGGSWGGRFSKPDGNHYSLEHNGVK